MTPAFPGLAAAKLGKNAPMIVSKLVHSVLLAIILYLARRLAERLLERQAASPSVPAA